MATDLSPEAAYQHSMSLVLMRLGWLADLEGHPFPPNTYEALQRAESIAHQVRKIVEAVAFAVLSGHEMAHGMTKQKRMDTPIRTLRGLARRHARLLPQAQDFTPGGPDGVKLTLNGARERNLDVDRLDGMWRRASRLLHERHPESLLPDQIQSEVEALLQDARDLRAWLWTHTIFFHGRAFAINMGAFGTTGFFGLLRRISDLPASSGAGGPAQKA